MKNAGLQFYGKHENSEFHKSTYIDLIDCTIKLIKAENENCDEKKKTRKTAADLSMMYYTLLNYLQSKNSDINYLSEYRYQYQKYHMIAKEKWYLQIWDRISWAICGFGERVGRFASWFISSITFFAICYMFSGLQLTDNKIQYTLFGDTPASIGQLIGDFGMCVHFSIVTFSTVGYGNITPLNGISTFLCTVQILVGLLFVAMFTSIMIKKLIRE